MGLARAMSNRMPGWTAAVAGVLAAIGLTLTPVRGGTPVVAIQPASGQAAGLNVAFGPQTIWQPSSQAIRELQMCTSLAAGCIRGVMTAHGASQDAIAFYELTGWFLIEISDTGVVQSGKMLNPWRANENTQPVLLGGIPAVIEPEQEAEQVGFNAALMANAEFRALQVSHPDLLFWAPGPTPEGIDVSPRGGPRFIFRYAVLDGCHACARLASVRAAFDFSTDGVYFGMILLDVSPVDTVTP